MTGNHILRAGVSYGTEHTETAEHTEKRARANHGETEERRFVVVETQCQECGAPIAGLDACRGLFDEIIAREFSDYRYARLHRLTVDTYSLQHPDRFMRSAKSFIAHLTGMCAAMENEDASSINRAVQEWLNGPTAIERPPDVPPLRRGSLTVVDVLAVQDPHAYLQRIREWAGETWKAWSTHHTLAREWIGRAQASHLRSRSVS
jgi:Family of unknown function (DUF5946)